MSNRKKLKTSASLAASELHSESVNALLHEASVSPSAESSASVRDYVSKPVPPVVLESRRIVQKLDSDASIALTVAEVCDLLKISRSTLYRSDLPGKVMVGGSVRYDKRAVYQWWLSQIKN